MNSGNIILVMKTVGNSPGRAVQGTHYFTDNDKSTIVQWLSDHHFPEEYTPNNYTVHGGLSTYESNTLFMMFYPYGQGGSGINSRIADFLDTYTPNLPIDEYNFMDRFTINNANVFVNAVTNSHKIFMEEE
ncbi:MAG TPA: hypothetical protein VM658_15315 [bacterium]|nr:hypothetical protein [bacterium]